MNNIDYSIAMKGEVQQPRLLFSAGLGLVIGGNGRMES